MDVAGITPTLRAKDNKSDVTPVWCPGCGHFAVLSAVTKALAKLLVEAIEHPGFAFLQVLSPCQTFRPEQKEWKHLVHPSDMAPTDDPVEAARFIQADDGMALGLFYVRRLPVWQPQNQPTATPADLEREFAL